MAILVLALTACTPIVLHGDGSTDSHAFVAITAARVSVDGKTQPAIQILLGNCATITSDQTTATIVLRPVATITDRSGAVVFANFSKFSEVLPPGSSVIGGQPVQPGIITVPVTNGDGPFTVTPGCTSYPGVGDPGVVLTWQFDACITERRACPLQTGGHLVQQST